jgi:hypothetical protein
MLMASPAEVMVGFCPWNPRGVRRRVFCSADRRGELSLMVRVGVGRALGGLVGGLMEVEFAAAEAEAPSSMLPPPRTKPSTPSAAFWLAAPALGLSRMKEAAAMASRPKDFVRSRFTGWGMEGEGMGRVAERVGVGIMLLLLPFIVFPGRGGREEAASPAAATEEAVMLTLWFIFGTLPISFETFWRSGLSREKKRQQARPQRTPGGVEVVEALVRA